MVTSELQGNLMPFIILFAITIINAGISVGFLLHLTVGITGYHIMILVILEIVALTLALRQSKRKVDNLLY
jgi:hypothetical protein